MLCRRWRNSFIFIVLKVMCDKIIPFDSVPKRLWIKYKDEASYETGKDELFGILHTSDGKDQVVIYLEDSKKIMEGVARGGTKG